MGKYFLTFQGTTIIWNVKVSCLGNLQQGHQMNIQIFQFNQFQIFASHLCKLLWYYILSYTSFCKVAFFHDDFWSKYATTFIHPLTDGMHSRRLSLTWMLIIWGRLTIYKLQNYKSMFLTFERGNNFEMLSWPTENTVLPLIRLTLRLS